MTMVLNSFPGLPVPPPTATPAQPPWEGEPAGTSDFGNLLRGLIYPCAGAPGFLAEAAPGEKPAESSPALAADIFNQDGFFRGAVPADEQTQPDQEIASEAPAPATQAPSDDIVPPLEPRTPDYGLQSAVKPGASQPGPQADAPTVSAEVLASAGTVVSTGTGGVHGVPADQPGSNGKWSGETVPIRNGTARTLASTATEPMAEGATDRGNDAPSAVRTASFRARLEALLPRLFAQESAALNTRVSIQAVQHGLQVVAKLDDLGREDRIRLRNRIAATLSRHGLIGREITLNGDKDMASAEGNH